MKVRVTFTLDDDTRRAIRARHGLQGKATREEIIADVLGVMRATWEEYDHDLRFWSLVWAGRDQASKLHRTKETKPL